MAPSAIPMLLFQGDLGRIFREADATLAAFILGAVGTILGVLTAYQLVPLGEEAAKLAGVFCATYIGGSMNFMATAEVVGLQSGGLLAAAVAADNLTTTFYFMVLLALPIIFGVQSRFPSPGTSLKENGPAGIGNVHPVRSAPLLSGLAMSGLICSIGFGFETGLSFAGGRYFVHHGYHSGAGDGLSSHDEKSLWFRDGRY